MSDLDEDDDYEDPTRIKLLQSILYQYPDGGQILKEILQNAEDAKATKVCFLYDETQYGTDPEKLHCPDLANFQGPALYAYNDAQFSEKDWRGIRSPYQSVKEKEPLQVGRFGLGFNSVFHITDLPFILSSNRLAIIDPHEKYFRFKDEKRAFYSWLLPRRWSTLQKIPHQYEPFLGVFGCDEKALSSGTFRGTIFRFPLRNQPSKLSNNIYSHEKIQNIFQTFQTEAYMLLMFLKHVVSVEVLHRKSGCAEPELVFKVEVNTRCRDLVLGKRQEFLDSLATDTWMDEPVQTVYPLQIVYTTKEEGQSSCINRQYLVCEYYAGGEATEVLKSLHNDSHIPLVGIAMPIEQFGTSPATPVDNERTNGQLFCFLPLPSEKPTETGLPVHINGYFAVSQNRHRLKLPTKGQNIKTDPDILWNHTLMAELIPEAYKSLLLAAVEFAQAGGDYCILPQDVISSIPDILQVLEPWTNVLVPLMTSLIQEPIFFSSMPNGSQSGWVRLQEAVLTDMHDEAEHLDSVKSVLRAGGVHVIDCPPHLIHAAQTYSLVEPKGFSPSLVKDTLCSKPDLLEALEHHQKLDILAYLLEKEGLDLTGLTLLPTADGEFVPFAQKGSQHVIYYAKDATERALLLRRPAWLLSFDLPGKMATQLEELAEQGTTQLVPLRPDMLLMLLPALLPDSWDTAQPHCIEQEDQAWVTQLWKYIRQHFPDDISHLRGLPILPVQNEYGIAVVSLVSPSKILLKSSLNHFLSDDCQRALQAVGVVIVKGLSLGAESHAGVVGKYILPPDTLNTFIAASEVYRTEGNTAIQRFIADSSEKDKQCLQKLWSQLSEDELLGGKVFLSELPLFELLGKDPVVFRSCSNVPVGGPQEALPIPPSQEMLDLRQHDARLLATKLGLDPMSMAEFLISEVLCKPDSFAGPQTKDIIDFFILNWNHLGQDRNFVWHLERFPLVEDMLGQQVLASSLFDPEDPFLSKLFHGEAVFPAFSLRESKCVALFRELGLRNKQSITAEHILKSARIVHGECGSISSDSLRGKAKAIKEHLQENCTLLDESVNGSTLQEVLFNLRWLPAERKYTILVLKQLKLVQQTYTPNEKAPYMNIVGCIYEQLEKEHPDHLTNYLQVQDLQNWIWTGDGFASIEQVVIARFQFNLSPYCVPLPQELVDLHKVFFLAMGIEEYVTNERLVLILTQIQALHENDEKEAQGNVSRDFQLAVEVLNFITEIIGDLDDESILIPVATEHPGTLVLKPITECAYRDDLVGEDEVSVDDDNEQIYLVNEKVPWNITHQLGVPSLMTRLLKGEDFPFGFGQIESLTNRLKSLLEDYPDGLSIPKEMIQNADDAKATTVKFLYDERENLDKLACLIHPEMAESQGPALWVYNDAMFTEEDFRSLIKLGAGTKENQPDKIGHFGLGFNAVYNITDVPSVVSGSSLVIFDPNMSNLRRRVPKPFVWIPLKRTRLLHKISDQIAPFLDVFGYTKGNYTGTLFRLPLRTKKQALGSAMCSKPYDHYEMLKLIKMLLDNAENMILFTQNVTNVEMYHIPKFEHDPKKALKLFSVKRTIEGQITQKGIEKLTAQFLPAGSLQAPTFNSRNFFHVLDEAMAMMESSGTGKLLQSDRTVKISITHELHDNAEALLHQRAGSKTQKWVISKCVGSGKALKIAQKKALVPIASVAVALQAEGEDYLPVPLSSIKSEGQLFCFLPLPIQTGLPLHINGPFTVQSNRRDICQHTVDDKENTKTDWNAALMEDAVVDAYIHVLEDVAASKSHITKLLKLWPDTTISDKRVELVVNHFYWKVASGKRVPAECHNGEIVTLDNAVFLEPSMKQNDLIGQHVVEILKVVDTQHHYIDLPDEIVRSFQDTGYSQFIEDRMYTEKKFFINIVLPNLITIEDNVRNNLVLYALRVKDQDIFPTLRGIPCIPASPDGKTLKCPHELIDPQGAAATLFTKEDGRFPHESFCDNDVLLCLNDLGAQRDDLTWPDVIERTEKVASLQRLQDKDDMERIHALCRFINEKLKKMPDDSAEGGDVEDVAIKLRNIRFLPLHVKPPNHPMKWKGDKVETGHLMAANEMYPQTKMNIVSSTQFIAVDHMIGELFMKFLGLQEKSVLVDIIFDQLKNALEVDPQRLRHESVQNLEGILKAVYTYLQEHCLDNENYVDRFEELSDMKCILIGDSFVYPRNVAYEFHSMHFAALHQLPKVWADKKLKPIMETLGVKQNFTEVDYIMALQEIHEHSNGKPLKDKIFQAAVELLNILADQIHNKIDLEQFTKEHGSILIPDSYQVLKPANTLCFNDCPWLPKKEDGIAHSMVPDLTAYRLGVKTGKQEVLSRCSIGIPFGQKQRLTVSIRRILKNYPSGRDVMKELLQNADDAKATKIHFILDHRTHEKERLFDDKWAPLQGPSLCIYNNSGFTSSDIEGIKMVREGSKEYDPNKIGQYGIGFNSVYHFTDAPSFLTAEDEIGEVLCVFDPQCKYVPSATNASPGRMYEELSILRHSFPDIFGCYLEDIFPQDHGNGRTIFRLPLRDKKMAESSELSTEEITCEKVRIELSKLKKEAFSALLFMNNLTEISISEIPQGQACLTNTYTVTCLQSSDIGNDSFAAYRCHVESAGQSLKTGQMQLRSIEVSELVYDIKVKDTEGRYEIWRISQRLGISDDSLIPDDVTKAFESQDICLTPRGGVAYRLQPKSSLVQIDKTKRPKVGGVSCFLPLPIETCLPLHVNGHFALGHESRQHLWTNKEYDGYRWTWNEFLCREVIAPAYVNLMLTMRNDITAGKNSDDTALTRSSFQELQEYVQDYQMLFPRRSEVEEPWHTLITGVYQEAIKRKAEVLPAIQKGPSSMGQCGQLVPCSHIEWLPPCPVKDMSLYLTSYEENQELLHVLRQCGMHVVCMESEILAEFETAEVNVPKVSPGTVLSYFSSSGWPNLPRALKDTSLKDSSSLLTVMKYIMKEDSYQNKMQNLPLCLTADGVLREYDAKQRVIRLTPKREPLSSDLPALTTVKTQHYFSFLCNENKIISECGASILHWKLAELMNDRNPQFLREITIPDIAEMLPHCPNVHVYNGQNGILWDKQEISQDWLLEFWQCISDLVAKTTELPLEEMEQEYLRTVVAPLSSWSLMPVIVGSQIYLKSLIQASEVINPKTLASSDFGTPKQYRQYAAIDNMLRIFYEAQIPLLDTSTLSEFDSFLGLFTTTMQYPAKVLEILHAKKQELITYFNSRTKPSEERQTLLDYFSKNLEELQRSHNAKMHLRELPLFQTKKGSYIPLDNSCVYIIPEGIPMDDMDVWRSEQDIIFLKKVDELEDMHKFIGCAVLTTPDVYCDFILKHFELLTEKGRNTRLYYLYSKYLILTEPPNKHIRKDQAQRREEGFTLLAELKRIPIIPGANRQLQLASSFYDPTNDLFTRLLPETALAPVANKKFIPDSEWLHFLRMLGMVQELTNQLAEKFAKQIAGKRAKDQSEVFTKYILNMINEQLQCDLLHAVKEIPFICPMLASEKLQKLYAQYGTQGNARMPFIRFRDGYHSEYVNDIWTVAHLLPEWAVPDSENKDRIIKILGMTLEPPIELLVNNLRTISHHITNRELHVSEYCDILKSMYRQLQERLETLTTTSVWPDVVEELQGVPCIIENGEKTLIKPGNAVLNMYDHDEIQPYLCKVSPQFGEFQTLFKALKCADIATVEQFAGVLDQINCDVSKVKQAGSQEKEKLTANELVLAYKAINGLFLTLENTKEKENISLNTLYLPSKEGQLVLTVDLLYNDCPAYYARVQHLDIPLLFDMRECGLTHKHQKELLDLLPEKVAVGLLSSHVKEHLLPSLKVNRHDNSITQELAARLSCKPFRTAVRRLIRHEANRASRICDDRKIDDMVEPLSIIKVYAINDLQTELHYQGKPIEGSQSYKRILCEKGPVVYIQTGTLDNKLLVSLAAIVNGILGDVLPSSVLHLLILMSCPLEDMQHELDECNIGSDNSDAALFPPTLPSPGSVIPTDQKQWVQMQSGGTFKANEYVALKELDAEFVYAVCKAPHDSLNKLEVIVGPCQESIFVFPCQLHEIKRKLEY